MLLTTLLGAQEYPDKGPYGSLNFLYTEDNYITDTTDTSRESFVQELKLGYSGNIYSPKLLEYTIEGLLRYDDENIKSNSYESKQKSTGNDYKAKLDFIKETKFPFTLYASKSERPISTVYDAYSTNYVYETRDEGATGSINFEPYMFTYSAVNTKTIAEFNDRIQNSQTSTYNTSFRYSENAHNLQASYSHSILENEQNYINDAIASVNQVKDMFNISHTWRASKDLTMNNSASYENDEFYQSESIDADTNVYWKPEGKNYDGSFSAYTSKMEYADFVGSEKYVFNSINLNQTFNYRLTENINLSENAMMYIYDNSSLKGSNSYVNLDAMHNYKTTIFDDVPFTLQSRVGVQKNDTTYTTNLDNNSTTTSNSVERYNFDVNARATKAFPSIKSTLNLDNGYYLSIYSTEQQEQRYNFGLYFLSKLYSIVNNNITARYTQTDRSSKSEETGEQIKNSYSTTSLMEMVDFYLNLGISGRVGFRVGVEYENIKSDAQNISRVSPRGEMNLNYRFFKSWMFDSSARVYEFYNTLEYSGNANLTFRAGKTSFLMGYQYNKSEIESVFTKIQNERSIFRAQLTRTF